MGYSLAVGGASGGNLSEATRTAPAEPQSERTSWMQLPVTALFLLSLAMLFCSISEPVVIFFLHYLVKALLVYELVSIGVGGF